jgi:hypothetical protein
MIGGDKMEIFDVDSELKMIGRVICGIEFGDELYVMYAIKRNEGEDNIFVSRLVVNSEGYTMDNNFSNGEKAVIDSVILRIINKDSIEWLNEDKIKLINDINLGKINKFSMDRCYVGSYGRNVINDIMSNYGLLDERVVPVVKVMEGKTKIDFENLALVIFGVLVLIVCIGVIFIVFVK